MVLELDMGFLAYALPYTLEEKRDSNCESLKILKKTAIKPANTVATAILPTMPPEVDEKSTVMVPKSLRTKRAMFTIRANPQR